MKAAKKHLRKSRRREAATKRVKKAAGELKAQVKDLKTFSVFQKAVDKAVKRGVIKGNKAGRLKSQVLKTIKFPRAKGKR